MNRANYSLDFDGSNDYVNTNSKLDVWVQPIIVEAWVNIDVNNIDNQIVHKRTSAVNAMFTLQITTGGKLQMYTRNAGGTAVYATGNTTISTGVWHHVMGHRSATGVKVYLDGIEDGTANGTAVDVDNNQNVIIGSAMGTTGFFNGRISRVVIWYQPASFQDILDKRFKDVTEDNPLLYYPMDEGTGTTVYTRGGNSNGTLNNFSGTYWVDGPPIQGSGSILID